MALLTVTNHGPLITASTYWGGELDRARLYYLSINTGCFRLLVPSGWHREIDDMRLGVREVVITRGPWPPAGGADSLEILLDDGSDNPYSIHLPPASIDRMPPAEDAGREFVFAAYSGPRRGRPKPHKAIERPCWYRTAPKLPWLRPRLQ